MEWMIHVMSGGGVAVIGFVAFYVLYLVGTAEAEKNTCPNPECKSNIKYCKRHIYEDIWVCEVCNHGLIIPPFIGHRRVSDVSLLHAARQRIEDSNTREGVDIETMNYLHRLCGILESRIQHSTEGED